MVRRFIAFHDQLVMSFFLPVLFKFCSQIENFIWLKLVNKKKAYHTMLKNFRKITDTFRQFLMGFLMTQSLIL